MLKNYDVANTVLSLVLLCVKNKMCVVQYRCPHNHTESTIQYHVTITCCLLPTIHPYRVVCSTPALPGTLSVNPEGGRSVGRVKDVPPLDNVIITTRLRLGSTAGG